jgi:hypothetical protein
MPGRMAFGSLGQCSTTLLQYKSKRTGRRWVISLIKKLWDTAWDLWQHRNEILHQSENHLIAEAERCVGRELTQLFNKLSACYLPNKDRYLIRLPLKLLKKKDIIYKEVWLHQARTALQALHHSLWATRMKDQRTMRGMKHVMHRWLRSRPRI